MKKNLYFRTVFRRHNPLTDLLMNTFLSVASWPRLLLEVFIRRNFGERYFSFSTAIVMTVILAVFPLIGTAALRIRAAYGYGGEVEWSDIVYQNLSWYLFLAAFIYVCLKRRREVKRLPSVFDFARFSLSAGEIDSRFLAIRIGGKPVNVRTIETLLEPGFFFAIGVLLWLLDQPLGLLLIISSIMYSLSYVAAYYKGDNFVMDKIDEMICNEELTSAFVDGLDSSQTRGVSYYGRRPIDPETRRRVADSFLEQEHEDEVIAR